ncbi:hypothetical protein [Stutzerimonas nitrititolerans]|nr:hypothetical protein [Stutzerimonas nitrititolerans]
MSFGRLRNKLRSAFVDNLLTECLEADERRLGVDCATFCTALRKKLRSFL